MADYNQEFRKNASVTRDDPRLTRREVANSPKHQSSSPAITENNWQAHSNNQYTQPLQTAYQHLQPTMYSDQTQYQGYPNAYPAYQGYGTAPYNYDAYGQNTGYVGVASGTIQPGPPGEEYPQAGWAPVGGYINSQPQTTAPAIENKVPTQQLITNPAVAQEMKHQKAELTKQREEYERRIAVLCRELDLLRRQKQDLLQDSTSDRDTELILRENSKLQVEIQNKLKDAYNVIEILTDIIGDSAKVPKADDSPKRERSSSIRRSHSTEMNSESRFNYVHYDPELHWCRMCDVFPKTAKDLLMHLHSKEHRDMMLAENIEIPWHKLPPEPEFPYIEGASKKRLPIKGLQFFVSATAWYCRLCDAWIGDLHCASQHLKSLKHSQNYSNFVEQNPHWEIEWMKDRDRAIERTKKKSKSSDSDENHDKKKKKHKEKYSPSNSSSKDKKKKKRSKKHKKDSSDSSSSSSSSGSSTDDEKKDTSKSIHVAMRNKMKLQAQMLMNEDLGGKWEVLGRLVEEHKRKEASLMTEMVKETETEDNLINQWMTVKQPHDKDKVLLDNLKDRLKVKQEAEKVKIAEIDRKRREKEKEEQELKEREEREAREREEEKQKEREEFERLKEVREQVKFRTREKQYRKRNSRSPDYKRKTSASPSSEYKKRSPDRYRRHDSDHHASDKNYASSPSEKYKRKHNEEEDLPRKDKKPPPPPPYKKLPFIGRMPLFKNKKNEERVEKEIKKEDYDIPRQTRFQPGNLARAFIPEPEVVCFPKLSSYPPISAPPPAPVIKKEPPAPPKISDSIPKAPPPPKIKENEKQKMEKQLEKETDLSNQDEVIVNDMMDDNPLNDYHEPFGLMGGPYPFGSMDYNMMYPPNPPMFDYTQDINVNNGGKPSHSVPLSHTMPLQPPPLPPDDPSDDLALLGISSDDLAAQLFK